MSIVTGIVKAKSANKFGYGINVNDKWYNSKFEIHCNGGDGVEFDDGGKNYVRSLKVVNAAGSDTSTASGIMDSKRATGTSYSRGAFPIPPNDGSRAIVRQNSITNAVALVTGLVGVSPGTDIRATAYLVVDIARIFEKYSSGDMDEEIEKSIDATFKVT